MEPRLAHEQIDSPWLDVAACRRVMGLGPTSKVLYRAIQNGSLRAARLSGGRGPLRVHRDWLQAWAESLAQPVEVSR